jgi:hypothetical protein
LQSMAAGHPQPAPHLALECFAKFRLWDPSRVHVKDCPQETV